MANVLQLVKCSECSCFMEVCEPCCPQCGSTDRVVEVQDGVSVSEMMGIKGWKPGFKRPFLEVKSGDSFSYDRKKIVTRYTVVDRENDHYKEEVKDPDTGEIIHFNEEPLSIHQGHGSAKRSRDKN